MSSFLDKLNLKPQERRLVVGVGITFFIVLNFWLVWPHFKDWNIVQTKKWEAERTLKKYQEKIQKVPTYEARMRELEKAGSEVPPEDLALDLNRTVQAQSRATGLVITRSDARVASSNTQTNQFFDEQSLVITVETGNEELVNFLVSLASTNSLIRVKNMDLRPHPSGTKLAGNITLVASYQKNTPKTPAPAPATGPGAVTKATIPPASKPGTNTIAKTK